MKLVYSVLIVCLALVTAAGSAEPTVVNLWPSKAPGETKELPPEQDVNKPTDKPVGDRKIIKLTNVSTPQLAIYRPTKETDTGAAVIVCPGGGHNILAYDHEGTEVAEWLNRIGVTGIVLKYRVPARDPDKRWIAAVQDAQRAVSLVRNRASEWSVDPQRIGILGFSAGGETAGLTAILHEQRQYARVDATDDVSCRPNFAALIYPGGFLKPGSETELRDYIKFNEQTPPMFFAHSIDDRVSANNSLLLCAQLKQTKVSAELHIYASGGHGYGIRQTGHACNAWPERCGEWMRGQGWLKRN